MPLHFPDGRRIDEVWTDAHKRALADYHAALPDLKRRYLQEDGLGVLWHDAGATCATLFNFAERRLRLPGRVRDLTSGEDLPVRANYRLHACHTYRIAGAKELPTRLGR
jgi:hypothetical protein